MITLPRLFNDSVFMKDLFNERIEEQGDKYLMEIPIPGIDKSNISVKAVGNKLIIDADNNSESRRISYKESFYLGNHIDKSKITSKYVNGLLTITLPKTTQSKQNEYNIEVT